MSGDSLNKKQESKQTRLILQKTEQFTSYIICSRCPPYVHCAVKGEMLSSRFPRVLQLQLRCQCQPRLFASSLASSAPSASGVSDHETELPINQFGVPLISDKLKSRIFPQPKKRPAVTDEALIKEAQSDLTKFGLTERSAETRLPDVTPYLPHITDSNISQHLWKVAGDQASTYTS